MTDIETEVGRGHACCLLARMVALKPQETGYSYVYNMYTQAPYVLKFTVIVGRFAWWVVNTLVCKGAVGVSIVDAKVHHTDVWIGDRQI